MNTTYDILYFRLLVVTILIGAILAAASSSTPHLSNPVAAADVHPAPLTSVSNLPALPS
jgi:hypothetical protein